MRTFFSRSGDDGSTWSDAEPLHQFGDGRWFIPTSPWKKWDGSGAHVHRMIALVSSDEGASWPEVVTVMDDPGKMRQFWESKIVELRDGRLCAVAWVHDESTADLPEGTKLLFTVRSAGDERSLDDALWRPVESSRFTLGASDRYMQYRAAFVSDNGDRYPVLDRVTIRLK